MAGTLVDQYVEDLENILKDLRTTIAKGELTRVDTNLCEANELV